jgi:hypothetical protein
MNKKCVIAWATGFVILMMVGCNELDNYSVSPNHQLSFSTDTLSFDTLFTTIGSTTGYFLIYNRNDEALKIEKILLSSGGQSGFRINVDGRKGNSFSDIPIWKKDSLYVAVEVTVDPNDEHTPFVICDSVVFITNGRSQAVRLEAYGQNAHILKGGTTFSADTTLTADRPYLIYDSVRIPENVTVRIEAGVSFYMHEYAKWIIDGTLKTYGTQEKPVTFRGDRLDRFSTAISYDHIAAQWDGLYFGASSFDNELNYTSIRNGISGLTCEESTPDRKKIDIRNSQIRNMDGNGLWAVNCHVEASNTEFGNASACLVMLSGGIYRFIHCTLANYMPTAMISIYSTRLMPCLTLTDSVVYISEGEKEPEKKLFPLQQAYFDNCIIDGYMAVDARKDYSGEIRFLTGASSINGHDEQFNYRFNHCVVKTKSVENQRFNEVIFVGGQQEESLKYIKSDSKNKEDKYDYIFDFRPAETSAGIGKADRAISELYPIDRLGVDRLASENGPTIGAYEFVQPEIKR